MVPYSQPVQFYGFHPGSLMDNQKEKVVETISNPDLVLQGDFGVLLAVRLYPKTPLTKKYLVVAYKAILTQDGFVLTAYFTSKLSERRETIWKP